MPDPGSPSLDVTLLPLPSALPEQRDALHRLATYVIAPARYQQTERFGLRATEGGFGTPPFGEPATQVRVAGARLVVEHQGQTRTAAITTLQAAADFIGSEVDLATAAEHDSPPPGALDEELAVAPEAVDALAAWWALGTEALEQVRADESSVDASIVQLWPGHFDTAIEVGDENRRASYGASPGDAGSDDPYLYVSVWWPDRLSISGNHYWNAEGFIGARMTYQEVVQSDDPVAAATDFFRRGRDLLAAAPAA